MARKAASDIVRTFPSLSAMVAASQRPTDFPEDSRSSRRVDTVEGWRASTDFDHALTLVHRWEDGAKDIDAMRADMLKGERRMATRTVRRPVPPGRVDVAGVAAGNPRAGFIARKAVRDTRNAKGKVVRVLVNVSAAGAVSASAIKRRGAAILALVDMLQARGLRVEVLGTFQSVASGRLEYRWTVKAANANTSLTSLAFGLAHPSMLRRVIFSLMECEPEQIRRAFNVGSGYGSPGDPAMAETIKAEGGIYLPSYTRDGVWGSDDTAREWVRAEVERVMG